MCIFIYSYIPTLGLDDPFQWLQFHPCVFLCSTRHHSWSLLYLPTVSFSWFLLFGSTLLCYAPDCVYIWPIVQAHDWWPRQDLDFYLQRLSCSVLSRCVMSWAQKYHLVSRDVLFGPDSFLMSINQASVIFSIDRSIFTPKVPNHTRLVHSHWNNICFLLSTPPHIGHVGEVSIPRRTRFIITANGVR